MSGTPRSQRLAIISQYLLTHPGRSVPQASFAARLEAARSSLSEDLAMLKELFASEGWGCIETVPGASGGVIYYPVLSSERMHAIAADFCQRLSDPGRILPGGFLYLSDLLSDPAVLMNLARLVATGYYQLLAGPPDSGAARPALDAVVTVETRGIPIAVMVAQVLGVPMVIIRRQALLMEGPVVTVNYLSGSRRIETMSLPRRALQERARVLLVDDFMKAGGTIRGMLELMREFGAQVQGAAVVVRTTPPGASLLPAEPPPLTEQQLQLFSLAVLQRLDEAAQQVEVVPATWLRKE
ncbi:MAG: pur operon repressor [Limnochordaceae bacterium]|nr:pur operon repressor [Limnochordaceae bacterium]